MKLGMILPVTEESFRYAASMGLDFVEFCINGSDHGEFLIEHTEDILQWIEEYNVEVGSIGRWKSEILGSDGSVNEEEIQIAVRLMKVAETLHCSNYICGCNYVPQVSEFTNYARAIDFFSAVLDAAPKAVKVSVYNCRKMNFVCAPKAWSLVLGHLPELGIKFDPSHSRYAGGDYLQELLDWGDRVNHVHLKGSLIVNGQRVDDPPAGLDQTDWRSLLDILRVKGYDRGLSIEPHSPVWQGSLGEKGIEYTVRYFRDLIM